MTDLVTDNLLIDSENREDSVLSETVVNNDNSQGINNNNNNNNDDSNNNITNFQFHSNIDQIFVEILGLQKGVIVGAFYPTPRDRFDVY